MKLVSSEGYKIVNEWLRAKDFQPFPFQEETWAHILKGNSGIVNAPTGFGKTYSVFLGSIIQFINENPKTYQTKKKNGLQLLWVTPLRALAKDIHRAMEEVISELGMQWQIGTRNGDTEMSERQKQKRQMPEVLIITPESLHLLLAQKGYPAVFDSLKIIAVDEWHELLGSKRGVQVELAISRLVGIQKSKFKIQNITQSATQNSQLSIWGISATIGNLEQAKDVLLFPLLQLNNKKEQVIVRALLDKKIEIISIIPDEIEKYPWAGHLGLKLADKVLPIIEQS